MPLDLNGYWFKKLCILAERCAEAELSVLNKYNQGIISNCVLGYVGEQAILLAAEKWLKYLFKLALNRADNHKSLQDTEIEDIEVISNEIRKMHRQKASEV